MGDFNVPLYDHEKKGRNVSQLLDTTIQLCVVFDVTQMSYQLSVRPY